MVFWKKQELHEDKLFLVLTQARSQVSRFWWEMQYILRGARLLFLLYVYVGPDNARRPQR